MRFRNTLALALGAIALLGCNDSTAPVAVAKTVSLVTATIIDTDTARYDQIDHVDLFFGIARDSGNYDDYVYLHPRHNPQATFMIASGEKMSLIVEGYEATWSDDKQPAFRAVSDWKAGADSLPGVRMDAKSIYRFDTRAYKIVDSRWQLDSAMLKKFEFVRSGDNTSAEAVILNPSGTGRYLSSNIRQERTFDCQGSRERILASTNGFVLAVNGRVTSRLVIPKLRLTCETYSDETSANMALMAMRAGLRR